MLEKPMNNKKQGLIKRVKSIMTIVGILLLVVILSVPITRGINTIKSRIDKKEGINESITVEIGGIKQAIQIRGKNIENPVILFLHGGPGFPLSYLSYYWQPYLEGDYTFVQWDQRGSGRTYYLNEGTHSELNFETMMSDTDDLVDYLCNRFEKEQVIIMGQSWGTVLGTSYVQAHPEKVSAYIGVGQVTDFDAGKIAAGDAAIVLAEKEGNTEDIQIIEQAKVDFKQSDTVANIDIKALENLIITSLKYLKGDLEMNPLKQMWAGLTSPNVSLNDLKWFLNASTTEKIFSLEKPLINYMYFDFDIQSLGDTYQVPMYFISGGNDWITPYTMVEDFYEDIEAPEKGYIEIEETGHTPFLDDPERFAEVVRQVLE